LDPRHLERFTRALPDDERVRVQTYLDSLSAEQVRGLAGTRDRLAILAESDVAHWLSRDEPTCRAIDLIRAVERRAVVCFGLEADRRPLMAQMLAAAIVQDLITVSAHYQHQPTPTIVLIDEFSAVCPDRINGLFSRARGAGFSLLLGTQELADLRPPENPILEDQVQGNITTLIAHRQVVPASAEKIAEIAGTRGAWITTQRIDSPFATPTDVGTRTRGREFRLHPDQIKQLPSGSAAVIVLGAGAEPRITRMLHPREAHK
jgi:type IV secretory pathway TraG/TraD family ATPase VirD4